MIRDSCQLWTAILKNHPAWNWKLAARTFSQDTAGVIRGVRR
ncbi:MAG: hypothetical protein ACLQFM_00235 [Terriglobales bacterium]